MQFDFIFTGFGLAGMMSFLKMAENGLLDNKSILIIEPETKDKNDRTWCFWEEKNGAWDFLVTHSWNKALFKTEDVSIDSLQETLKYKMIESKSFYDLVKHKTTQYNVTWKKEKVTNYVERENLVEIFTEKNKYKGHILFNSIFDWNKIKENPKFPLVQQHFLGWFVKSEKEIFNPEVAYFMDFSVEQNENTRFMYVLPITHNEALIEYTLFSPNLLQKSEYEIAIKDYVNNLGANDFKIIATEQGNIPMTTYPFWKSNTKNILNIGSAGGWTKASTGFTFKNADRETDRLIIFLKKPVIDFRKFKKANKFTFYDDLFVTVLYTDNQIGKSIFTSMFTKTNPKLIFKFLDEKTIFFEDFKVIMSCPKKPFIKSLFRNILK